ncbi:protein cornichon homolog 4 isoform X1 [Chrysemys picta bellii]|uniref:protein cornichon homolog 4 isoform X1 n=2 Tax=Chrysemys picta bellii TaxID=8478 RepID=UPI0032B19179
MESVVFIFSLIDCCALIFLSVYFIITLSDLECDYINARSCCSKLNKFHSEAPAYFLHGHGADDSRATGGSPRRCAAQKARSLWMWVVPELIGHTIVTVLMLISLHWFIFLLNLPVATWNIYRFIMVPSGNLGVFDPTEIHNRGQLKSHMKEAMIKLGFHLLCFFMYLYSMILALIND